MYNRSVFLNLARFQATGDHSGTYQCIFDGTPLIDYQVKVDDGKQTFKSFLRPKLNIRPKVDVKVNVYNHRLKIIFRRVLPTKDDRAIPVFAERMVQEIRELQKQLVQMGTLV